MEASRSRMWKKLVRAPLTRKYKWLLQSLFGRSVELIKSLGFDRKLNVICISIRNGAVAELPAKFASHFRDVESLVLTKFLNLTDLSTICRLKKLEALDLVNCPMVGELPLGICESTNLRELRLVHCVGIDLATSFRRLDRLEKLWFVDHDNSTLPPEIGLLSNLRELGLYCVLDRIPQEIGQLGSLEYLYILQSSEHVALPKSVGNLLNLKELELSYCSRLPEEIGHLSKLEKLTVHFCPDVEKLPTEIWRLPNLVTLDLLDSRGAFLPSLPINIEECSDSLVEVRHSPKTTLPVELKYILALNRAGRRILRQGDSVTPSLWPHLFERCTDETDALLFFLTQKPELIQHALNENPLVIDS